jgi:glycosyltransferase involved in cell wall biosynthesis
VLTGRPLADAYHAMDVFVFTSQTETQGMVLAEAMAAGVPVVALDAPGAREVVRDGRNGRLLREPDRNSFVAALRELHDLPALERSAIREAARRTAEEFTVDRSTDALITLYERAMAEGRSHSPKDDTAWAGLLRLMENEWNIWSRRAQAVARSLGESL